MKTLGQIAYEAYAESVGWVAHSGTVMPPWDEQDERLRKAWEAAAEAVHDEVRPDGP